MVLVCVPVVQIRACPGQISLEASSSPALVVPPTRRSSVREGGVSCHCCQGVEQSAVSSQCCINPAFIPSSPESSSIHHLSYIIRIFELM